MSNEIFLKATPQNVAKYQEYIQNVHPPSTRARKMSSLRRFFSWAQGEGYVEENPLEQQPPTTVFIAKKPTNFVRLILTGVGIVTLAVLVILLARRFPIPLPLPGIALITPTATPTPTPAPPVIVEEKEEIPTIMDKLRLEVLELFGTAPKILALEGQLLVESLGLNLTTSSASDGDITLAPDGAGQILVRSSTTVGDSLAIANANLTTGSLISGYVGHNGQNYNFLEFSGGSVPSTRFLVDALGNTNIAGNLNLIGGALKTAGTTRLSNTGALQNITGYEQLSGNFKITQSAGDSATISKTATATVDLLTLNLDETGLTKTNYDTLAITRKNAGPDGFALEVRAGLAMFRGEAEFRDNVKIYGGSFFQIGDTLNDTLDIQASISNSQGDLTIADSATVSANLTAGAQVRVGLFGSDPTSLGNGTVVYNTTTNKFRCYEAGTWKDCISGVLADSLDFIDFEDTMDLDADLILNQTTFTWTQNFTGTTTTGFTYNADSLTSGEGLALFSSQGTTTNLFTGNLADISFTKTYNGGAGSETGNTLEVTRSLTRDISVAGALTVSGELVRLFDTASLAGAGSGTLTHSADVLTISQAYTANTGAALNVTTAGTGLALRVNDDGTLTDTTPFVVDASGSVGIGTAIPGEKLEVVGNVKVGDGNKLVWASNTNEYIGESSDTINYVSFFSHAFYLDSNADNTTETFKIFADGVPGGGTELFSVNNVGNLTLSSSTSTADRLTIAPSSAAGSTFTGTLTSANLTANRTWTLPDDTGTICLATGNCGAGGVGPDSLDFTEFKDAMALDATTSVAFGAFNYIFNLDSTGDFIIQDNGIAFVTFADTGLTTFANDVEIDSQLAVGSTASITTDEVVSLNETYTNTSGTARGLDSFVVANPSAASSATFVGARGAGRWDSTQTGASIVGVEGLGQVNALTTGLTNVVGGSFLGHVLDTITASGITNLTSVLINSPDAEDATVTNAHGLHLVTPSVDTGSLTTSYGIRLAEGTKGTGTITTQYGIYIPSLSIGTTNWDIFHAGTAPNIAIGNTGTLTWKDASGNTLMSLADAGTTGNLTLTGDLAVNGGDITSTVDLTINPTGGDVIFANLVTLNIGGSGSDVAFNAIGDSTTGAEVLFIGADNDLYIQGDLEVDGNIMAGGSQILNANGTVTIIFTTTPTSAWNILDAGAWQVSNTANVGQAALAINQTLSPDIFTASASGTTRFVIQNDGDVGIGTASPAKKLDVVGSVAFRTPYSQEQQITLTNGGGPLSNHEVLIQRDTATPISQGKMQADCDDIRFVDSDQQTSLAFWLEQGCNTASTQFWVRVPSIPTGSKTIRMVYGNSNATAGSQTWSGNFILMSNAACPSGWTRLSALDGKFPRGSATYGGTGGASTHTNTLSGATGGPSANSQTVGGTTAMSTNTHTHSFSFPSGSADHTPPFLDVVFCTRSSPSDLLATNFIAWFTSLPGGWTNLVALNTSFPRGSATYGGTGGASTHSHTYSGTTGGNATVNNGNGTSFVFSMGSHSHSFSGTTSTDSHLPSFLDLIPATPNSASPLAEGIITGFDSTPPMGWTRYSSLDATFPRGNSTSGSTGGSNTHTHTFSATTDTVTGSQNLNTSFTNAVARNHNHTISSTTTQPGDNLPPYQDLLYYQRNTMSITIAYGSEQAGGSSNPIQFLYDEPTSNVGIGTTVPDHTLHLSSTTTQMGAKFTAPRVELYLDDTQAGSVDYSLLAGWPVAGKFAIRDMTAGVDRIVIDSTGNVGIGTGSPGEKLEVNGSIRVTNGAWYRNDRINYVAGAAYYVLRNTDSVGVRLDDGATAWAAQSDIRLKDIIEPIDDGIQKILAINPVIYRLKTDDPTIRRSGIIGQDVQKVLPEAVSIGDDGYLNVRYTELIPLTIAAIKEQQKQIEELKSDVYLTDTGDLQITKSEALSTKSETNSNDQNVSNLENSNLDIVSRFEFRISNLNTGELITRIGAFGEAAIATLRAGLIEAQLVKTEELLSPVVETTQINTKGKNLVIDLKAPPEATESAFGKLIVEGGVEISGDATVAGTLTVGTIYADDIIARSGAFGELLAASISAQPLSEEQVAELEERLATLESGIRNQESGTTDNQITLEQIEALLAEAEADQALAQEATTWDTSIASDEAQLDGQWSMVNGQTNNLLGNLAISGELYVGPDLVISHQSLVISHTAIDTLTAPLSIQSLAAQPLQIMGDKVIIATNGDVTIKGNLTAASLTVDARLASESDLPDGSQGFGNLIEVLDRRGIIAASVDSSGSATFKKLVIAAEEQTNATAGQAILPAGTTELVVRNSQVNDNTLVYITPTSPTENKVLYVKAKQAGEYFVVAVDEPISQDVTFNFWIIDLKNIE